MRTVGVVRHAVAGLPAGPRWRGAALAGVDGNVVLLLGRDQAIRAFGLEFSSLKSPASATRFDGRVKYSKLLRPGEGAEDAVYREKLREDALRDQGWQMARWGWDDLKTPQAHR